jgi:alpha-tubulin suppressor-like RCC1 family protein
MRKISAPTTVALALVGVTSLASGGCNRATPPGASVPAAPAAAGQGVTLPVAVSPPAATVACGSFHTCAVAHDRSVRCWGHGGGGQLGNGGMSDSALPVAVRNLTAAVEVAAGEWFSCARREEGSVWCWGRNEKGQLGDDTGRDSAVPVRVRGLTDALEIAAGERFACARTAKDVFCWGQLGILPHNAPIALNVGPTLTLSAGAIHGCLLTQDGRTRCFGANYSGQLGGAARGLVTPPQSQLAPVIGVSAGGFQSCAWTDEGALYCWGNNELGSLGTPYAKVQREPKIVRGFGPVAWARSGYGVTCALGRDEKLRCLGTNASGQLGVGKGEGAVPVVVPLTGVSELAMGSQHACARLVEGSIYCWGANYWGELGDGTTSTRAEPRRVSLGP